MSEKMGFDVGCKRPWSGGSEIVGIDGLLASGGANANV
jgi:hypothetical protein